MTPPRHVLITGAAGAIGAALARAMRAAWPAAHLSLLDRDPAMTGLAAQLGAASIHEVDLRDLDALPAAVAAIEAAHGPLDGLVNCAGVMRVAQLTGLPWDAARDLLAIDLLAPLRLQDLVARGLTERGGGGVIVNVASMAGKVPLKGCAYYGAAKAGLAMASEVARADLAPLGIRVVTVYPGPVRSALERGARAAYAAGGARDRIPTGDADQLAARIVDAVVHDRPRVVYPRAYAVGMAAPNLARWIALSYGPTPQP